MSDKNNKATDAQALGNVVIELVQKFIDGMKDNERTNLPKITEFVASETGVSATKIRPFVSIAVGSSTQVEVKKGRTGGVIKRPASAGVNAGSVSPGSGKEDSSKESPSE